jgi:beta-glucanase (GH16 family)
MLDHWHLRCGRRSREARTIAWSRRSREARPGFLLSTVPKSEGPWAPTGGLERHRDRGQPPIMSPDFRSIMPSLQDGGGIFGAWVPRVSPVAIIIRPLRGGAPGGAAGFCSNQSDLLKCGQAGNAMFPAVLLCGFLLCGLSSGQNSGGTSPSPTQAQAAAPIITTTAAQNGAVVVSLSSATSGATIFYTIDGATPTSSSIQYLAPFLVASNLTVKAIAAASDLGTSSVSSKNFAPNIVPGTLVWSDEFSNSGTANAQPNAQSWNYDTGTNCCGNHELETYCEWGSTTAPCNPASPNAFVGTDGYLHVVAEQPTAGVYTSARLKTRGQFSFQYGRIEARMMLPESPGMWPAFWLLGNNIATIKWPACGELDVMEHINGSNPANEGFDWVQGSVHGTKLDGGIQYHPAGFSAAAWHTYGMIWTKGRIQYYVDSPSNVFATFTSATQAGIWPFDQGPEFVILNLAVGGDWPHSPDATTVFPSTMLVDYVRIYSN